MLLFWWVFCRRFGVFESERGGGARAARRFFFPRGLILWSLSLDPPPPRSHHPSPLSHLEQVVARHPGLARHARGDDDQVAARERLAQGVRALVADRLGLGVDVADVGGDALGAADVVEGQVGDVRVHLLLWWWVLGWRRLVVSRRAAGGGGGGVSRGAAEEQPIRDHTARRSSPAPRRAQARRPHACARDPCC